MNDCLHPRYYSSSGIEAIDFIDAHGLNFNLGNVIKYRHQVHCPRWTQIWYLEHEFERL